ncbi:hypothetical protein BDF14DRAFT_1818672 [Spinellus fusiger]|nr:hypothetical protein BDF14DRAFT_1818672 [Spinellus fusiger]
MTHPIINSFECLLNQDYTGNKFPRDINPHDISDTKYQRRGSHKDKQPKTEHPSEHHQVNRWQSFIRHMSFISQQEEVILEDKIRKDMAQVLTEHDGSYVLDILALTSAEDYLPSMEEIAKEGAEAAKLAELKTSYFENPFEMNAKLNLPETRSVNTLHPQDILSEAGQASTTKRKRPELVSPLAKEYLSLVLVDSKSSSKEKYDTPPPNQKDKRMNKILVMDHSSRTVQESGAYAYPTVKENNGYTPPPFYFDAIKVAIADSKAEEGDAQRPSMLRIELYYGDIKWVIKRGLIEVYNLHLLLKLKSSISSHFHSLPPFPDQLSHLKNSAMMSIRSNHSVDEKDKEWHEALIKRRLSLETYLRELIRMTSFTSNYDLYKLFELSAISIVKDMGWKGKEGYLEYKWSYTLPSPIQSLRPLRRGKEWLILRDSYILFCKDVTSSTPSGVFLFDKHFKINRISSKLPSYYQTRILITNGSQRIKVKCPTTRLADEWMESLMKVQSESPWVVNHRFGSFAPIRANVKAKWFVDGNDYFEAVAEAILAAKSTIYIEDWWLSPELFLKRPPSENEEFRIDRLLKRKAEEGVMIYIVIYKNLSVALPLNSQHTMHWLQSIHPNVIVQRHASIKSRLWAHHEKILVVDYRLAFIGGLDLCFGRYDTPEHPLSDYSAMDDSFSPVFPGQDYSNPRIKYFKNVIQYNTELINKRSTPRMPWHDIHVAMVGPPARDIARHFIQRWNYIKSMRAKDRNDVPFLVPKGEYVTSKDEDKFRGTCRVQIVRSSASWSQGIPREYSIYSAYMENISKAKHFIYIENQFFITATHPDDKLIKNKIGEAIVERIKRAHKEKQKFRVIVMIPCAPGFEGDFTSPDIRSMPLRSVAHYQYMSISRGGYSIIEKLKEANIPVDDYIGFYSLRNWGKMKTIDARQCFASSIHLQESSLMSLQASESNKTCEFLIDKAFDTWSKKGGAFCNGKDQNKGKKRNRRHSIVSMAILRSGNIAGMEGKTNALLAKNQDGEIRGDLLDGRSDYVTEQVYIHSKLMIVDDRVVLCGSANINDRSQLGHRDSEIAVVIEDTDLIPSKMNGQPYNAGRYALTLRMRLFKEHLGLLSTSGIPSLHETTLSQTLESNAKTMSHEDLLVLDPLDSLFYKDTWKRIAKQNTVIYRNLFRCVPDDTVHTVEQHREFIPNPEHTSEGHIANPYRHTNDEILSKLYEIQGHLVEFPTQYLCNTNMIASIMKEAIPPALFT